ncbi:MAG: hypothetical protein KF894_11920 [Labilithrix sp.]|nr:hypothetical protein [Labilithrix sp.]
MSAGCFLLVAVGAVGRASADEDPRKAQADALFQEGLKLHDKDREAEALEKFEKAYEALPSPNALFWVAREKQLLGRSVAALRHYRAVLDNPMLHPGNAKLARGYVAELEKATGRVTVNGPAGTTVTIEDVTTRLPMSAPLDVDVGTVMVRGEREGERYEARGLAVAGGATVIELGEPTNAPRGEATVVAPPQDPPVTRESSTSTRWLVSGGVGVVGLAAVGTGIAFALAASSDAKDIEKLDALVGANGTPCESGSALPECSDLTRKRAEKRDHDALATGFLIGGAAALVGAGALALLWPRFTSGEKTAVLRPLVSPTFSGLQLRSRF